MPARPSRPPEPTGPCQYSGRHARNKCAAVRLVVNGRLIAVFDAASVVQNRHPRAWREDPRLCPTTSDGRFHGKTKKQGVDARAKRTAVRWDFARPCAWLGLFCLSKACPAFETAKGPQAMHHKNTVIHGLLKAIPRWRFERLVNERRGVYRDRTLSFWNQFGALIYAQLAGVQSLRELVGSLDSQTNLLYHLGMEPVARSTLSDANRDRP